MHGLIFATPLAFVGLAVSFARWSYRRTSPFEPIVIAAAILALSVMTVATSFALQEQRTRYTALERQYVSSLVEGTAVASSSSATDSPGRGDPTEH